MPELDFGLDDESLLDYSDEHDSDEEDMQLSLDVRPRATSPPATSRTLGQQLHEVALRAASCLGLPLPSPPSVQASLLDGEFYAGPTVKLTDREKAPLLDAPVSVQGVFGEAVETMAAKFEEQQKSREV